MTVAAGDSTTVEVVIDAPQLEAAKAAGGDIQLQWHFTTEANDVSLYTAYPLGPRLPCRLGPDVMSSHVSQVDFSVGVRTEGTELEELHPVVSSAAAP